MFYTKNYSAKQFSKFNLKKTKGKPKITYTTPNATIYSTDQLKLTCQAYGSPKPILTWHYNGQLLLTTARIYYDNKINSTTTSNNKNNNKIYINQYGNGININSFPLHNRTASDLVNINEMKRYYGVVVTPSSSSSSSSSSANNNNNNGEISFDLILPSTAKKRSGKFSCFAANAIGRDEKHSFVTVLGENVVYIQWVCLVQVLISEKKIVPFENSIS